MGLNHTSSVAIADRQNESAVKLFTKQCNCAPRSVTGSTVLPVPRSFSVTTVQNRPKKIGNRVSVTISINCFCNYMFIFKKVWAGSSRLSESHTRRLLAVVVAFVFPRLLLGYHFPKFDNFCFLTYQPKWKCATSLKMIFFHKINKTLPRTIHVARGYTAQ